MSTDPGWVFEAPPPGLLTSRHDDLIVWPTVEINTGEPAVLIGWRPPDGGETEYHAIAISALLDVLRLLQEAGIEAVEKYGQPTLPG